MDQKMISHIELLTGKPAFRAWCLGEGTRENTQHWDQWMAKDSYHVMVGRIARQIVLELEQGRHELPPDKKIEQWRKIANRIEAESEKHRFKPPVQRFGRTINSGWFYTVAASLLLILISFLVLEFTNLVNLSDSTQKAAVAPDFKTVFTAYGEQKIIQLESGTRIILNANSEIRYRDGWVFQNSVGVQLSGEAYFDVAKRDPAEKPAFRVETADGSVSVLGTRFVVSTRDHKTRVVLEEGKVAIEKTSGSYSRNAILKPDQLAEFSQQSDIISIGSVNTELYTSWTRGFLVFDHTSIVDLAHQLTQTYGIKVEIADPLLLTREVSGSIENEDLQMVTSALSKVLEIPITRQDDKVIIGTSPFESIYNKQSAN